MFKMLKILMNFVNTIRSIKKNKYFKFNRRVEDLEE